MSRRKGWDRRLVSELPWGLEFARRENYEIGFLESERQWVQKYLVRPGRVLVLGSGNGREARPILGLGHRILCLDLGRLYLQAGQKLAAREGAKGISFVQADVRNGLPLRPEIFDFVFFSLYSHLGDRRQAVLREVRRLVPDGGLILQLVCTEEYPGLYPSRDLADWTFFRGRTRLEQEIRSCGLELLDSQVDPERREYRVSVLRRRG